MKRWALALLLTLPLPLARAMDAAAAQLIVSIAPDWDSATGRLQLFTRQNGKWQPASAAWRVQYGRDGLAWGRGELGAEQAGRHKVEHDHRSPAGLFALGQIYTYDGSLPPGADYPFHTVTGRDAWIDDPANPQYNRHVEIPPGPAPSWFDREKMKLGDPPHRWLVEIRHNADPPVAGAGSAIFFHIQRGSEHPTSGCTVMPEESLLTLIRWLRADRHPHYVLLPRKEYLRLWKTWGLPPPEVAADVLGRP